MQWLATRKKTLNTNVTVPAAPSASAGSVTLVNTFDIYVHSTL